MGCLWCAVGEGQRRWASKVRTLVLFHLLLKESLNRIPEAMSLRQVSYF